MILKMASDQNGENLSERSDETSKILFMQLYSEEIFQKYVVLIIINKACKKMIYNIRI